MNLKDEVSSRCSKAQAIRIATFNDEAKFDELMQLVLNEDKRWCERAAWVMSHCTDKNAGLLVPHIGQMVEAVKNTQFVAVKRNIIRALSHLKIPEVHQGELVNIGFDILLNPKEAVAVQVFSMTIIYNISLEQPDLQEELRVVIEDMLPHGTPGIKSRGKRILKKMK